MYVVEFLTLRTWWSAVFLRLLKTRGQHHAEKLCLVIEGSRLALAVARASGWLIGVKVERFPFRLMDIRDARGVMMHAALAFEDIAQVQHEILEQPEWRALRQAAPAQSRFETFFAKRVASFRWAARGTLSHALLVIRACAWKAEQEGRGKSGVTLFIERQPWHAVLARYAAGHSVVLIPVAPRLEGKGLVRRWLGPARVAMLRSFYYGTADACRRLFRLGPRAQGSVASQLPAGPTVAVEYYGLLNLDQPERYSNLFFWQASSLPARHLVLFCGIPSDPLDARKWAALSAHGMTGIATHVGAGKALDAPRCFPWPRPSRLREVREALRAMPRPERRWCQEQVADYEVTRALWSELFAKCGVKLFVSWYKYDATHAAVADALQSLGGVTAIYQQSYEPQPSPEFTVASDIVFNWAARSADVERQSGSTIFYHVATGYLGDHRFRLLRGFAQAIRETLQRHGATRILSYADENSHGEGQWYLGDAEQQDNYAFLLEQVLRIPWLGLVVKPKKPSTLSQRLGPVARLLERAEATGRCHVLRSGSFRSDVPPAQAALASDLMIHGHLWAGTAGIESALAGVPTLLLDRERWVRSPLHRLGIGRVVFRDWESLWRACLEHWNRPGGLAGFGDWSLLLDELDPFRDGRAAERMGTYLHWLLEGFQAGLPRETVLADAAERYAQRWGKDYITQVMPSAQFIPAAPPPGSSVAAALEAVEIR